MLLVGQVVIANGDLWVVAQSEAVAVIELPTSTTATSRPVSLMNTPSGKGARTDEGKIRAKAVEYGVPCITTIQAAEAAVKAMEALREEEMDVQPLQERFRAALDAAHDSAEAVS